MPPPEAESLAAGKAQLKGTKPEPSPKTGKAAATVVTAPTAARAPQAANKVARSSAVKAAKAPQATTTPRSRDASAKPSAAKGSTKAGSDDLEAQSVAQLRRLARERGVSGYTRFTKAKLLGSLRG